MEKIQLAADYELLKQQKEELEKNIKSKNGLATKKLSEAEETISNLSSGVMSRNEEISRLRQEIESKNK